jgi:MerR family mercuric resistance operon transcriptional regulator
MAPQPTDISIGELSRRARCNIDTIRYYERIGLLPSAIRSAGRYRLYGVDDVRRLTFVRRARELGFKLDEVRALLKLASDRGNTCAQARKLAAGHLADIRAKIADLQTIERVLATTVRRCGAARRVHCPVIEVLAGNQA